MEFASSYFYVRCAATTEPSERPRAPLPGEGNNARTGEVPVLPMYQPVEGCGVAMGPVYDQVYEAVGGLGMEGQGATYMNHSTLSQPLTPSSPVYADQPSTGLYPPQPTSSYDGSPSAPAPEQPAKPTPIPIPPPRRSRRHTPQVTPPPLPPRPPNMRKVPNYVEVMEQGPRAQSGVPVPLPAPLSPDKVGHTASGQELTEDVNVVLVNLAKLMDIKEATALAVTPTYCQDCSAAMSSCSHIQELNTSMWECEFCHKENCLDYRHNKGSCREDQVYVQLMNPTMVEDVTDSLVVFCVDISGSMSVTFEQQIGKGVGESLYMSRLQAVQEAVSQSLDYLLQTSPRTRVTLVTFNNEVTIYGDGLGTPRTLQDFQLIDQEYLKSRGIAEPQPRCISESRDALRQRIHMLQECGSTALGPAALVSIAMASRKPGSKVIICTDGRANTILGNLEDIAEDKIYQSSKLFYSHMAEYAMKQGVIISVLTIEGTDCRLLELGQLADKTGGKVNITNPASLYSEFELILDDDVIATNVTLTFIAERGLYFKHEDEVSNKCVKQIGNVVKDMTTTFQFGIKEEVREELQRKDAIPFQLQLGYRLPDGRSVYRIVSQERPTTTQSALVKKNVNLGVLQIHAAQTSARLAMDGRMRDAQVTALTQRGLIEDVLSERNDVEQEAIYESWAQSMNPIYSGLSHLSQQKATAPAVYEAVGSKKDRDSVVKSISDDVANVVYRLKNAKKKMFKKPKFLVAI